MKNRKIKVYSTMVRRQDGLYRTKYETVPQIRLQGKWLEELGFESGAMMHIQCSGGN